MLRRHDLDRGGGIDQGRGLVRRPAVHANQTVTDGRPRFVGIGGETATHELRVESPACHRPDRPAAAAPNGMFERFTSLPNSAITIDVLLPGVFVRKDTRERCLPGRLCCAARLATMLCRLRGRP